MSFCVPSNRFNSGLPYVCHFRSYLWMASQLYRTTEIIATLSSIYLYDQRLKLRTMELLIYNWNCNIFIIQRNCNRMLLLNTFDIRERRLPQQSKHTVDIVCFIRRRSTTVRSKPFTAQPYKKNGKWIKLIDAKHVYTFLQLHLPISSILLMKYVESAANRRRREPIKTSFFIYIYNRCSV